MKSDKLRKSAKHNTEKDFEFAYFDKLTIPTIIAIAAISILIKDILLINVAKFNHVNINSK